MPRTHAVGDERAPYEHGDAYYQEGDITVQQDYNPKKSDMGDYGKPMEADAVPEDSEPPQQQSDNRLFSFVNRIVPYGGLASNCFSLGSVTLGGGIISMADSFRTSGIIMAFIYLLVVTIITIYSMYLIGMATKKTKGTLRNFEEMGGGLFGKGWDYFVGAILFISCVGTAIGYVSALGTLMTPILKESPHTSDYFKSDNGNHLVVTIFWAFLLVPVVIPKHINSIRYVSVFGVCMVLYFVVTIVVHSCLNGLKKGMRGNMAYFTTGNQAIYGISIFIFGYMCQSVVYSVYFEMKPRPSVRQLTVSSTIAMFVCMVFYIFAGLFGYFDFADDTKGSILENFNPYEDVYMMVAYMGMLVKICAAYAMNMVPIRNFLYHCLRWDLETNPYWKHVLLIVPTSAVVLVAGLFIPSVNLAFGLVGSITGGFVGFIFPALFWMYSGDWSLKTVGFWHWISCYLLIVCGVIAIVFGTIATVYSSFFDV
ncbi:amino acid permease 3 [Strigomonas culicis]|uniref:Amino acid permease 3 n=1 Tax=Strigomonas culicis TaxID=28005 RepID=S9TR03_9TRYP|nr:amino acid permease 3 [Strigomonas culicis]|eukprot:EPY19034.1 amino acid permease 3 [Strigomonas culicis]